MQLLLIAAAAAQTFNLACAGTVTHSDVFSGTRSDRYAYTYRIDLDKAVWCDGECKATHKFDSVLPTALVLEYKDVDTPSEKSSLSNTIDRETGAHHILSLYRNPHDRAAITNTEWKGQCERQPFSGFPSFETKF